MASEPTKKSDVSSKKSNQHSNNFPGWGASSFVSAAPAPATPIVKNFSVFDDLVPVAAPPVPVVPVVAAALGTPVKNFSVFDDLVPVAAPLQYRPSFPPQGQQRQQHTQPFADPFATSDNPFDAFPAVTQTSSSKPAATTTAGTASHATDFFFPSTSWSTNTNAVATATGSGGGTTTSTVPITTMSHSKPNFGEPYQIYTEVINAGKIQIQG